MSHYINSGATPQINYQQHNQKPGSGRRSNNSGQTSRGDVGSNQFSSGNSTGNIGASNSSQIFLAILNLIIKLISLLISNQGSQNTNSGNAGNDNSNTSPAPAPSPNTDSDGLTDGNEIFADGNDPDMNADGSTGDDIVVDNNNNDNSVDPDTGDGLTDTNAGNNTSGGTGSVNSSNNTGAASGPGVNPGDPMLIGGNPPVTGPDTFLTLPNRLVPFTESRLLSNDATAGNPKITSHTNPPLGSVTTDANGAITGYLPGSTLTGLSGNNIDSFTYTVEDDDGDQATETVTIIIDPDSIGVMGSTGNPGAIGTPGATGTGDGESPTAVPDQLPATDENTASIFTGATLISNDTDPQDTATSTVPLTIDMLPVSGPLNGTVASTGNPDEFIYTPNPGFTGTDSFTYSVRDPENHRSTSTVSIDVNSTTANPSPTPQADTLTLSTSSPQKVTFTAAQLLSNDTDPNDAQNTLTLDTPFPTSQPANGIITEMPIGSGNYEYELNAPAGTGDSFTYTVVDPGGKKTVAEIRIANLLGGCPRTMTKKQAIKKYK